MNATRRHVAARLCETGREHEAQTAAPVGAGLRLAVLPTGPN